MKIKAISYKKPKKRTFQKTQKRRWAPLNIQDVWWVMVGAISRKVARKWGPKNRVFLPFFQDFIKTRILKTS